MLREWTLAALLAGCSLTGIARAQQAREPALQDLEKVQRVQEAYRQQLGDLARNPLAEAERRLSGQQDARRRSASSAQPDLGKLTQLAGQQRVDPAALAERYANLPTGGNEDRRYQVIAFVTLGMPQEGLLRLARDVKKVGGAMVLRGTKHGLEPGTWLKSLEAMKPVADTGVDLQINPALFAQFGIKRAPAIVVSPAGMSEKACGTSECRNPAHALVYGDVSLSYALDSLADREDAIGRLARELGDQLQ